MVFGVVQILCNTSVTSTTLWPSATSNHGGLWSRIGGPETSMMLWPLATTNCGYLWPQNSVYDFRKSVRSFLNSPLLHWEWQYTFDTLPSHTFKWDIILFINVGGCSKIISRTYDIKNLVAFGHKQSWRPPAANRGSCDFNDVVAFGHNQLWRPPAAKFRLWYQKKRDMIFEHPLRLIMDSSFASCKGSLFTVIVDIYFLLLLMIKLK